MANAKNYIYALIIGGGLAYAFNQAGVFKNIGSEPEQTKALRCIVKTESTDKDGFFYNNNCNKELVVKVCKTYDADSITQVFGQKPQPQCEIGTYGPTELITFANVAGENSSLLSKAISVSSVKFNACLSPHQPVDVGSNKYVCK